MTFEQCRVRGTNSPHIRKYIYNFWLYSGPFMSLDSTVFLTSCLPLGNHCWECENTVSHLQLVESVILKPIDTKPADTRSQCIYWKKSMHKWICLVGTCVVQELTVLSFWWTLRCFAIFWCYQTVLGGKTISHMCNISVG